MRIIVISILLIFVSFLNVYAQETPKNDLVLMKIQIATDIPAANTMIIDTVATDIKDKDTTDTKDQNTNDKVPVFDSFVPIGFVLEIQNTGQNSIRLSYDRGNRLYSMRVIVSGPEGELEKIIEKPIPGVKIVRRVSLTTQEIKPGQKLRRLTGSLSHDYEPTVDGTYSIRLTGQYRDSITNKSIRFESNELEFMIKRPDQKTSN